MSSVHMRINFAVVIRLGISWKLGEVRERLEVMSKGDVVEDAND